MLAARRAIENNEKTSNCGRRYRLGRHACPQVLALRAEETETLVWGFVSGVLKDPERLRRGLDEMLEQEKALASSGPDVKEERLLDLYLEGKLETDRYESRASQLKMSRKTGEEELDRIEGRAARVERMESDREALLGYYVRIVPERLDALEPEERNRVYKMLDLTVSAHEDGKRSEYGSRQQHLDVLLEAFGEQWRERSQKPYHHGR